MQNHVYKVIDLVGTSEKSIEDAIVTAVTRASHVPPAHSQHLLFRLAPAPVATPPR